MIQFERGKDPKESLNIGLRQKRIFKDIEEAADWCARFPDVYTDGFIQNWLDRNSENNEPFFDISSGCLNAKAFTSKIIMDPTSGSQGYVRFGKLAMVKWLKSNIHFAQYPNERIGLKECKEIVDRTEELIKINIFAKIQNSMADNDLDKIIEFIEELKNSNYNLRETKGDLYIEGLFAACDYIKEFIEGLRL